jgi:hypothetical protein
LQASSKNNISFRRTPSDSQPEGAFILLRAATFYVPLFLSTIPAAEKG